MQQFVDSRCRYWIQQRIGEMMNNNNFTSSHGLTLSIETDSNAGGYCFNFSRNGQTIAKINENGLVTCSSLWVNGLNILSILNTHNLDINGLTDGTFDLNVHSIIADIAEFTTINSYPISPTIQPFPYIPVVDSNGVIPLLTIATNLLNIFTSNNAPVELHIGKETNYGIIKYEQEDSTLGFGYNTYQNMITFDLTTGAINGAVIAPTDSSVTPTVSFIPVVKSGDLAMSIGKCIDFHDVLGDSLDYRVRLDAQSDGALRIYNNNGTNHPLQVISNNGSSVQVQFGRYPQNNYMAMIQFNYAANNGSTLGLGLWNHNNVVLINQSGDITAQGGLNASGILSSYDTTTGNKQLLKCGYDGTGKNYVFLAHNFSSNDSALNSASVGLNNGSYIRFGASDMSLYGSVSCDDSIYQLKSSLSANQSISHYIGRTMAESCRIFYTLKSPLTDSYMNFAVNGTETLKMLYNLVESLQNFKCPNLTVTTDASIGGNLDVSGNATIDILGVSSNASILGNLDVLGSLNANSLTNSMKVLILKIMYPVGSVYMSATSHDNPNTIFGVNIGTWTEITNNTYLLCSDEYQTLREEGGSFYHKHGTNPHTLTVDEIPSHYHKILGSKSNNPGTNPSDCVPLMNYGSVSEYWERNNYNNTYIDGTGGGQAHNHGDTTTELVMPPYYRVHAWYRSA